MSNNLRPGSLAAKGKHTKLPLMHDLAPRIVAGETAADLAAEFGITEAHMRTRLRVAGIDADTGLVPAVERIPFERSLGDEPQEWMVDGLCLENDPAWWFGDDENGNSAGLTAVAKKICVQCPVREQCLDYALRLEGSACARNRHGIWGGLSGKKRHALATKRAAERAA